MTKVTIVTPCYNAEKTIEQTIKSVAAQTYSDIHYIIIDGGSNDGTMDIVKRYFEEGIVDNFVSEPDNGIADAFSKGIIMAAGDYVQIVNADDWLNPDQIEKAVAFLNANPQYGFCYGDLDYYSEEGAFSYHQKARQNYQSRIHMVMPVMNHPTFLVRKSAYDQIGVFDETYKIAMDYEWILRAHVRGVRGAYCPGLKGNMREGGVSHTYRIKGMKEVLRAALSHSTFKILPYVGYAYALTRYKFFQ